MRWREVVGESQIERIQTSEREQIQLRVRDLIQKTLDSYQMGVMVTRVQMLKTDPPARSDRCLSRRAGGARRPRPQAQRSRGLCEHDHSAGAGGQAAHIVQDAEAYRQQVIAEAGGQAKRFVSVYEEYKKAPAVTRKRIYLGNAERCACAHE